MGKIIENHIENNLPEFNELYWATEFVTH
jgi:hypothetical protein